MTKDKYENDSKDIKGFDEIIKKKERLQTLIFIYGCGSFFIMGFVLGLVIGTR